MNKDKACIQLLRTHVHPNLFTSKCAQAGLIYIHIFGTMLQLSNTQSKRMPPKVRWFFPNPISSVLPNAKLPNLSPPRNRNRNRNHWRSPGNETWELKPRSTPAGHQDLLADLGEFQAAGAPESPRSPKSGALWGKQPPLRCVVF